MDITFASLLTAEGAVIAAGIVTTLVEIVKRLVPTVDDRIAGGWLAFGFSAALYVLAAVSTGVASLDAGLLVFLAWLACATSAVGIHSTVEHARGG